MEKICHANSDQKKAGTAILISERDFRARKCHWVKVVHSDKDVNSPISRNNP